MRPLRWHFTGASTIGAALLCGLLSPGPLAAQSDDRPVFMIDATLGSLFDTNANRRPVLNSVYGAMGRMRFRLATSERRPLFAVAYIPGYRTSSTPTRHDGLGFDANALLSIPFGAALRFNVLGVKSQGGVDDDLNPTDQMMVRLSTDLDLDGTRLRTYVAHRWRRLGAAGNPAIGQYVAADLKQRLTGSTALIAEWRYERLEPQDTTRQWARLTAEAGLAQDLGKRLSLEIQARRRWRDHPYRVVDDETDPLVFREDLDLRYGGALAWRASETTTIELEYEFDERESTDEDRSYERHWFGLTIRQRLITLGGRR